MGQQQGSDSIATTASSTPKVSANESANDHSPPAECPVDHKAREAWLQQGVANPSTAHEGSAPSQDQSQSRKWFDFFWSSPSPQAPPAQLSKHKSSLSTEREISTIPRGFDVSSHAAKGPGSSQESSSSHSSSSTISATNTVSPNSQSANPRTSSSGNWIYPSEEMFFNAMRRKSYDPRAEDMKSVIPIHNAVNEKTWQDILAWEKRADPTSGATCGGPKLISFSGDSQKLTPRARLNILLGYEKPFDRHDWIVDRCGKRVEYVIDYYTGKKKIGDNMGPSFYLDVRPKLNSWEGYKMRMQRTLGWDG